MKYMNKCSYRNYFSVILHKNLTFPWAHPPKPGTPLNSRGSVFYSLGTVDTNRSTMLGKT
jgi:hypothetical protein